MRNKLFFLSLTWLNCVDFPLNTTHHMQQISTTYTAITEPRKSYDRRFTQAFICLHHIYVRCVMLLTLTINLACDRRLYKSRHRPLKVTLPLWALHSTASQVKVVTWSLKWKLYCCVWSNEESHVAFTLGLFWIRPPCMHASQAGRRSECSMLV